MMDFFRSYASFEDMIGDMQRSEAAANERVTDAQKAIDYGDYWLRQAHVGGGEYLTVYGRCWTRDEIIKGETEAGSDVEAGELEYTMAVLDSAHSRGYRFSTAYSQWEPDGEIGDVHISTMAKITKELFDEAKALGWPGLLGES
jgi:hypothetical protein